MATVHAHIQQLTQQRLAKFLEEGWPVLVFLFTGLAAVYPCGLLFGWNNWYWAAASVGAAFLLTVIVCLAVFPVVRRQTREVLREIEQSRADAAAALTTAGGRARDEAEQRYKQLVQRRDNSVAEADAAGARISEAAASDRDTQLKQAHEEFPVRQREITQRRNKKLQVLNDKHPALLNELDQQYETETTRLRKQHEEELVAYQQTYENSWNKLVNRWETGFGQFQQGVAEMNAYCDDRFPLWDSFDWKTWKPAGEELVALRFGHYGFRLDMLENGVPRDPRLEPPQTEFSLPATLSFPDCPSLLLEAVDEGRDAGVRALQNLMLRLLISLPPGKVRYTIIDPTGLGQNFSAFMHLADYDERLVTNRIWTESAHINQRLADLTEHMEKVIQKYLRNEFESIEQYNRYAGEVAEPFQILVVANFPANFSEEATRRLVSIATSGARCGVYTLITCDSKLSLPRNFDMSDLRAHAATLQWAEGGFHWFQSDLKHLPLMMDEAPGDEQFTQAVRAAGSFAQDAIRVEVPFSTVAAEPDRWWTSDSSREIEVALGRAGATKLQHLKLGKGTSQHVLISGKTGSGKSTLLHALITNLAIHYDPDQVHFYLIDFKKGVEFKPYAAQQLPHAHVIAIESEREFGLSVLERLDLELRTRGDLFREQGVQDLTAYRKAHADQPMPRVLLIIDEFQEFFVKDDKLAQNAALLLDRLVRQGRAFGIHVLLGSQTLAGAYSLARSTIGQMAVRIALQCSEADSHLILSEENTAARLLSRPGEAIYNDANGLLEGNHPFQVVWLPDTQKETLLQRLGQMARKRNVAAPAPIVFEGNVPADPSQNHLLVHSLQAGGPPTAALAPRAWLGAAVAIKDPTVAVFRRQSGTNLLVVGQQEETALGLLANAVASLGGELSAAQTTSGSTAAGSVRFRILDGTRANAPHAGFWRRAAEQLPWDIQVYSPREAAAAVGEIWAEADRRLQAADDTAPPLFLLVYNLSRFRDLKKSEDDFGFSSPGDDETLSADKQFTKILREGPVFGVHTIAWCDSFNSTSRWLDRQTLHDVEMRVLFQMTSSDSSNLMDSPEASRLGVHRAIFYSEEHGQYEKFRPYGPPSDQWLDWLKQQLAAGSRAESPLALGEG